MTPTVDFFLMSNLSPKRTGLPFVVWISPKAGAKHDIRVKISPGPKTHPDELVTIALRPDLRVIGSKRLSSEEFALLKRWVKLNLPALVAYWEGRIEYTEDVLNAIKSI